MRSHVSLPVVGVLVASLLVGGTLEVLAQRGGRGGGGRGGGGMRGGGGRSMSGGGRSMGGMGGGMRSSARPSVSRPAGGGGLGGGGGLANRSPTPPSSFGGGGGIANRPGGAGGIGGAGGVGGVGGVGGAGGVANRPGANRPGGADIGNRNNINTGDRNTNIDVDGGWNGGSCWGGSCGCCHHPVAAGLAVGAAAAVTAAVIGSTVYSLPVGCQTVIVNGLTYNDCAGTWYQPQFVGTETTYIVVDSPQ